MGERAYCGINCDLCEIRVASNNPEKMAELVKKWQAWQPDATSERFRCDGCRNSDDRHWIPNCAIRRCARAKGVEHCGRCSLFKCERIRDFENEPDPHHACAIAWLAHPESPGETALDS